MATKIVRVVAGQQILYSVRGWWIVAIRHVTLNSALKPAVARAVCLTMSLSIHAAGAEAADRRATSSHWAYQPPTRPVPPAVKDDSRVRTDVDGFIQRALEADGLSMAREADRATLIRRVSLDLTGLPPSLDELDAYLAHPSTMPPGETLAK